MQSGKGRRENAVKYINTRILTNNDILYYNDRKKCYNPQQKYETAIGCRKFFIDRKKKIEYNRK